MEKNGRPMMSRVFFFRLFDYAVVGQRIEETHYGHVPHTGLGLVQFDAWSSKYNEEETLETHHPLKS